jgi:hypothetical protein
MRPFVIAAVGLALAAPLRTLAGPPNVAGGPVGALQAQVRSLQEQIDALNAKIEGIKPVPGPQGPPGVANGISRAVHGTIAASGAIYNGVTGGFAVQHEPDSGRYTIVFDTPFPALPDCIAQRGVANLGYRCEMHAIDPSSALASCTMSTVVRDAETTGYDIVDFDLPNDLGFSFICVY